MEYLLIEMRGKDLTWLDFYWCLSSWILPLWKPSCQAHCVDIVSILLETYIYMGWIHRSSFLSHQWFDSGVYQRMQLLNMSFGARACLPKPWAGHRPLAGRIGPRQEIKLKIKMKDQSKVGRSHEGVRRDEGNTLQVSKNLDWVELIPAYPSLGP